MCMTYTTSQDEKAMLRVFMRLQGNDIGFEMPIYITHAFKFLRLQVINTGFEMPICVTHAFKCVRLQLINTGFEMPICVI